MQKINRLYQIHDNNDINRILEELKSKYTVGGEKQEEETISIYDTFDWRLYHSNLKLTCSGNTLTLKALYSNSLHIKEETKENTEIIHLSPNSLLLQKIKSIIKIRTLMQHAAVKMHSRVLHLFAAEQSPAVDIEVKEIIPVKTDAIMKSGNIFLTIDVPGQTADYFDSIIRAEESPKSKPGMQDLFFHILTLCNIKPGNYSSKINVKLLPHMTTETACRILLSSLLHTMIQNEEGIKNDVDSEFLHDFRVAIRRTRSLLSQVKKVFPKPLLQQYLVKFKYFAKLTNEPRDIDVYLLKIKYFKQLLPPEIQDGLIPLHNHLKERHALLYKNLVLELESEQYRSLTKDWYRFLDTPIKPGEKPSKAEASVLKTAKQVIRKQYRIVVESGLCIKEESPPAALHTLRIECKKLRYLLEFFSSLFPDKIMKKVISRMKILQDNLGTYQDLQVQQEMLSHFLKDEKTRSTVCEETEKAIAYLTDHFKEEEESVRKEFCSIFKQFANEEVRITFHLICGHNYRKPKNSNDVPGS